MSISDNPEVEAKKEREPVHGIQLDSAAAKQQSGLITLPSKPKTPPIATPAPSE